MSSLPRFHDVLHSDDLIFNIQLLTFCFCRKYEIKKQANFSGDLKYAMYYDYEYFVFSESETQKHNNNTSLNDVIFIPNVPLLTVVSQIAHNSLIPAAVKTTLEGKLCFIFIFYSRSVIIAR